MATIFSPPSDDGKPVSKKVEELIQPLERMVIAKPDPATKECIDILNKAKENILSAERSSKKENASSSEITPESPSNSGPR